jgi:hypothetical protein
MDVNMSISLNDLKDKINGSVAFGPLSRNDQRIFHLGRELKTGGRSLSALGVGRFKCFTVHLLAKGGSNSKNSKKEKKENDEVVEVVGKRKARALRRSGRPASASEAAQPSTARPIIDVGDSDDDDDDDVVEVVAAPPKRRRGRR